MKVVTKLIYALSKLPFWLLYGLANFIYFILYYIIGYRKTVVANNLQHAFPHFSEEMHRKTRKLFYRHFADIIVETIKILSIKDEELLKRCRVENNATAAHFFSQTGGSMVLTAHFGNWEWAGLSIGKQANFPLQVIYKKLKDAHTDALMYNIRSHFGNEPVAMDVALKQIIKRKSEGAITAFLADQTPLQKEYAYWLPFLNRLAPFYTGPEKIAQKLKVPVYFGNIIKEKRGFYRIDFTLICEDASATEGHFITEKYAELLEQAIKNQPHTWLWSHKRWKHKYQPEFEIKK